MSKKKSILATILIAGLTAAMALALSGCFGGHSGGGGTSGNDDDGGLFGNGGVVGDTGDKPDGGGLFGGGKKDDGIYTLIYYEAYEHEGTRSISWTYDEHGSCLNTTWNEADGTSRTTGNHEFDEYGASTNKVTDYFDRNGNLTRSRESSDVYTYDAEGRLIQDDEDDGVSTYYEYYPNGVLKMSTNSQGYQNGFDEQGRKNLYDGGFLNRDGRGALTISYGGVKNNEGSFTASFANGESYTFTFQTDKNGNIVAVFDPNGNQVIHAEYTYIADPCSTARTYNYTRNGTFIVIDAVEAYLGV
ncbi:MAG: hypothetical protein IJH83_01725 [Coriobacteriales bacterium]|nr:hypothetical protein [Coriobacteriales bacterium]